MHAVEEGGVGAKVNRQVNSTAIHPPHPTPTITVASSKDIKLPLDWNSKPSKP